jgi:predicted dehydrogenase
MIGYEHEFVHAVVDFVKAASTKSKIEPSFYDGMKEMEVLDAGLRSAETGKTVELS